MPHEINDECINCGSCHFECSFDAIFVGAVHRMIDPARCQDCGACAKICPVEAIEGPFGGRGLRLAVEEGALQLSLH